jgi:hypothetical protein
MSQSFSALINVGLMASLGLVPTVRADPFAVQTLVDPATGNTEYRMLHSGFHFATLLITSASNALVFRPHPDQGDDNGWGSSLYLNPRRDPGRRGRRRPPSRPPVHRRDHHRLR